jgi:O-antigen/teichoic acid export membrane protein
MTTSTAAAKPPPWASVNSASGRAPLQLFQAVQTSILPHLTRLRAGGESDPFRRSINLTLAAIAVFAALVALVMLALGPTLMDLFFGGGFAYGRGGLVLVAVGMGLYLAAATLNQAALARSQARAAALCWAVAAAVFAASLLAFRLEDRVLQVEIAFVGGAALLCLLLGALYRRGEQSPATRRAGPPSAR